MFTRLCEQNSSLQILRTISSLLPLCSPLRLRLRYWRSYSQDSIVQSHFSSTAVNYSVIGDSKTFARQLWLSQLAAALQMKQQIETFRATNIFGTLIWQLGEIFPTGGWGSLEYAHAFAGTPGRVSLVFGQ
jgi:hypothetical protein